MILFHFIHATKYDPPPLNINNTLLKKMAITTILLLLYAIILFLSRYVISKRDKMLWSKSFEDQKSDKGSHSSETKNNTQQEEKYDEFIVLESLPLGQNIFYINYDCTNLSDFIINEEINEFDLKKLARLNQIPLDIPEAWYLLVVSLIKELDRYGWDKKVSCIKEKYAGLRFYIKDGQGRKLRRIINHYQRKSEHVCMTCGARGEVKQKLGWFYVACQEHSEPADQAH